MTVSAFAILTAAGSGTRLGAEVPKALVTVGGETLLRCAARGLLDSGLIEAVVVTAPTEHVETFAQDLADMGEQVRVVAGSPASRQASVALGLDAAMAAFPEADVVLVHDAARCLTPVSVIQRVVQAVRDGHKAVIPALPVTDTVKEVRALEGTMQYEEVVGTPNRAHLRAVQTPQGFETGTLLAAHRAGAGRAGDEALAASDDAGLVEAQGGTVTVVPGDPMAFKITTPLDLALAQTLLSRDAGH